MRDTPGSATWSRQRFRSMRLGGCPTVAGCVVKCPGERSVTLGVVDFCQRGVKAAEDIVAGAARP